MISKDESVLYMFNVEILRSPKVSYMHLYLGSTQDGTL